jgi:hypothetical protein
MNGYSTRVNFVMVWVIGVLVSGAGAERAENLIRHDFLPAISLDQAWKLVWQDEFMGETIDKTKWESPSYERRGHLWRAENAYLDKKGHLVMETSRVGDRFASPCLRTIGKYEKKFGLMALLGARLVYCDSMSHCVVPKLLPTTFGELQAA